MSVREDATCSPHARPPFLHLCPSTPKLALNTRQGAGRERLGTGRKATLFLASISLNVELDRGGPHPGQQWTAGHPHHGAPV